MKPARERVAGSVANFVDERTGAAKFLKKSLTKVFPDHWSFMLGEIALYSFIILLLTGVYLTIWFKPSMNEVIYNGTYQPLVGIPIGDDLAVIGSIHLLPQLFDQVIVVMGTVAFLKFLGQRIASKVVRERIAGFAKCVELAPSFRDKCVLFSVVLFFAHYSPCLRLASMKLSSAPSSTA